MRRFFYRLFHAEFVVKARNAQYTLCDETLAGLVIAHIGSRFLHRKGSRTDCACAGDGASAAGSDRNRNGKTDRRADARADAYAYTHAEPDAESDTDTYADADAESDAGADARPESKDGRADV